MNDHIQRFLFKELNIRGQHLNIHQAWQEMIKDRHYPDNLTQVLGELTAVAIMLANGMKHSGKVSIQVQGSGPVNLLVVQVSHTFEMRGVAKTNQTLTNETGLDALLGDGQILVTLENTQTGHFFQSYVPREADSISDCFEAFLSQSEQLPSKLWLAANNQAIGGVLIQKMPTTDEQDEDGWERITHLSHTVTEAELLECDATTLLHRLFHEETIELYPPETVHYDCPQDQQAVETMLKSLGETEVRKILEEQGQVVIHNEMCNLHFKFDESDINRIFSGIENDSTLH
ncbi:molecular chaperone Hsp33 [Hydrogenovibrio sp. SC-1]|uniref:Hsp33 family molecular chaperone HslO n=1 Tax=Hydrogenovibrio sp. SC-1 TaxID=2065820 RepID=UPI000C7B68E8|nr:Hsp33 family molecular chaperone HslO [Hydrogenovibrio sp. SC-1]PLA75392.1 molecular chaperone Hsp33 [Hydrogenovibrio sp. SC-1]